MKRSSGKGLMLLAVCCVLNGCMISLAMGATADAKGAFEHAREAPELVQAALDAEAAGDAAARATMLAEALRSDPDFAPAHWHSGEVKIDGKWRTLAQIESVVEHHPRWNGYRKLRESLGDATEDHRTLALYCQKHRLLDEGRFHWANLLLANPQDGAARRFLGLVDYEDGLYTHEHAARLKQSSKEAKDKLARTLPMFLRLCRDAQSPDLAKRLAALKTLSEAQDPAVIEALEQAIDKTTAGGTPEADALHRAAIAALTKMPQYEATLRLLNYAVFSESVELRRLAAAALAPRPQTDYVPLLMSALMAPVDVQIEVLASPDGTVRMLETVSQVSPEAEAVRIRSANFETEGALRSDPTLSDQRAVLQSNLAAVEAIAAETQAQADEANAAAEVRNARIKEVLQVAAGLESDVSVEEAWARWESMNELTQTEKTRFRGYDEFTRVYQYPQLRPMYAAEGEEGGSGVRSPEGGAVARAAEPGGWRNPAAERASLILAPFVPQAAGECFVPGTPVWTPRGPRPIESIAVGDLVLSQHPQTGELAFRAVLQTTLGDAPNVVRLQLPKETIQATGGHRFWVNRRGWTMAKALSSSTELHSLLGPIRVEAVQPAESVPCHNLIVDEFHTYFVGASQILVHDKGCPTPVVASVPGSATVRNLPTLDPPLEVAKTGW